MLQAPSRQSDKAERVMVRVAAEESHKPGNGVAYSHPKDLLIKALLFAQVARKKYGMIQAQRFHRVGSAGIESSAGLSHQLNDISFRIAEAKQPANARFHSAFRAQDDGHVLLGENLRRSVEFVIIGDLEGYVMEAPMRSYQLEYMVVAVARAKVKMLRSTFNDFKSQHVNVKLRLAD